MAIYLLDTNAIRLLMRNDPHMAARVGSLSRLDRISICPIVRGEVRYGLELMEHGRRREDLEKAAEEVFLRFSYEPVSEEVADCYGRIKRATERKGTCLDENDLWIAATALSSGSILVTSDTDFERVDGLRTEDWSQ